MTYSLWQPPRLRQDDTEATERRATWLELFYDLVFVAAISQLAHYLSAHLTWAGAASFGLMFVPLWWCWVGATFYATRFDADTLADRLLTFVQMGIVVAMAVNTHHGLKEGAVGFALCYALFRGLLIGQYLIAGYFVPQARSLARWYSTGFGVSVMLWFISVWVPAPWRYLLWLLGLLVDFTTPLTAGRLVMTLPPSMTHIPERVGLFTIIVLGESIIGVVNGLAELDWTLTAELTAILGLAIACSLWWLYFDSADGSPLKSMQKGRMAGGITWLYAHLPLTASLTMTGVGVEHMVKKSLAATPDLAERWLFCSAIAVALIVLAAIHWLTCTLGTPRFRQVLSTYRLASAAFVLFLGATGEGLTSIGLVTLVALACIIQVVMDIRRRRQPAVPRSSAT
ncbi:MAG: low temperature requirement protein A [Cyanobacteria bacterium J06638_20]